MHVKGVTLLKVAALAVLLSATSVGAQDTPQRGGTLVVGLPSDSKTFDPTFSVQFTERQLLYLVFNTLVRYDTDFSIKPELAESWTIENDGKRIVFKLRPGVKFHDGTAFDAAAVKWNIEHRLDKEVASPQRALLEPIGQAQMPADKWTHYTTEIQPYLEPLDAVISAIHNDGGIDRGTAAFTAH
jgi:peptide/nickel transport system substrate-binding protein